MEVLQTFYKSLTTTTILDPTCGTGAFLFAALDILSPLYEACLTKMQELVPDQPAPHTVAQEPLRYFIHKSILTRNLYGVEIIPEAVEVCKLCLSLKLLAQVEKPKDWEGESFSTGLLNVLPGNALLKEEFDWDTKFPQVMQNGKFRVIIGNPPYAEYTTLSFPYTIPDTFQTRGCGELSIYVVEQSQKLLAPAGYMGMIVPIADFGGQRKLPFIDLFYEWFSPTWLSFYHCSPTSLFSGVGGADTQTAIFLARPRKSLTEPEQRFSTQLIRWKAIERDQLFSGVRYHPVTIAHGTAYRYYPKLGSALESSIMEKIINRHHPPVQNYFGEMISDDKGAALNCMSYRCLGGRDWKVFMNSVKFSKLRSNAARCYFDPRYGHDVFVALFNSSLFFWYSNAMFDATRNTTVYMVNTFPFTYPTDQTIIQRLRSHTQNLMNNYHSNTDEALANDEAASRVHARKAVKIIDKIDDTLAEHYGLTKQELKFILNYDRRFRLGRDYEGEVEPLGSVVPVNRGKRRADVNETAIARPRKLVKKTDITESSSSAPTLPNYPALILPNVPDSPPAVPQEITKK